MSDQDWANGPAGGEAPPANGDGGWSAPGDGEQKLRRSPSPRRERSRSPMRGIERGRTSGAINPGNNLHVSGISARCEDGDLEALFSKYGPVQKSQVMKDPHTREVRGFGFVTMENPDDAEAAIAGLNASEFLGKVLNVEKARRGRGRTPTPGQYHGPPKRDDPRDYRRPMYDDRYGRSYRDDYRRYDDRDRDRDRDYYRRDDRYGSYSRDDRYGRDRDDRYARRDDRYDDRRRY